MCLSVNVCDCQRVKLNLQTVLGICCSLYGVPDLLQSKSEQCDFCHFDCQLQESDKVYFFKQFFPEHVNLLSRILEYSLCLMVCVSACEAGSKMSSSGLFTPKDVVAVFPCWVTLNRVWKWLEGSAPVTDPQIFPRSSDCPLSASSTQSFQLQRRRPVTPRTWKTHCQRPCLSTVQVSESWGLLETPTDVTSCILPGNWTSNHPATEQLFSSGYQTCRFNNANSFLFFWGTFLQHFIRPFLPPKNLHLSQIPYALFAI